MLIHEVSRLTGLTRKAIEYYIAQGLLSPDTQENGYRDFSPQDVETLEKTGVLRRLGLSAEQIREILADDTGHALQEASVRAELAVQHAQKRRLLLDKLAQGGSYAETRAALDSLEEQRAIIDRLMDAFPGYLGRFLAIHFAPYLDMPISAPEQRAAYDEIIAFLDDAPPLPEDICRWMDEAAAQLSVEQMTGADRSVRDMVNDPDQFAAQLDAALPLAAEFHASEAGQFMQSLKRLFSENGYYDVFIPALRRLSPEYDAYSRKLAALDALLADRQKSM